jgi:hypothetical protein
MVAANRANAETPTTAASIGHAVLESMRSSFKKVRLVVSPPPVPTAVAAEEVTKAVWLKGNLISNNGKYFPQLTLHTDENPTLLEAAVKRLEAVGFDDKEWNVAREDVRFCMRYKASYANPQDGYIALSGMVWEACNRTGLQYANLSA